ncbi:MAG: sigma-E factor negative regulatory protein [Gammaproteobacteria bacterium]
MSTDINQEPCARLSALMDGEVGDFELRRTLGQIGQDPELRRKWNRYHLAAAAMRGELSSVAPDLSGRIAAALEREPGPRNRSALRTLGRVAVAASVAVVTVVGVRYVVPTTGAGRGAEVAVSGPLGGQPLATGQVVSSLPSPVGMRLPPVHVTTVSGAGSAPPGRTGALVVGRSATEELEVRRYVEQRLLRQAERNGANRQGMLPVAHPPQQAPVPAGQ